AFTIMLTTFLAGLALGASIMSGLADRIGERRGLDGVAAILAATGLLAFGTLAFLHKLPYAFSLAFQKIHHSGGTSAQDSWLLFGLQFLLAAVVMLPPTLFLGGMFPLVVKICGDALKVVGRTVGTAYAANTAGTILGSALGGFLLIPLMGIQGSIVFAIVADILLALLLVATAPGGPSRVRGLVSALLLVAAAGCWALQPQWNTLLMNSGVYKYAADMTKSDLTPGGFYDFTEGAFDLVYYKEGVTATVMVASEKRTKDIWLSVNGKIDASSYGDLQTQLLSGHIPLIFADDRSDVVVIGYASGITVGATTTHPVKSVTAVEIEPAVIEASKQFTAHNHDPLHNPKVKVVEADGRNFLLLTDRKYDAIISEPSNPWMTVASNLFTREFFQIGKDRLRPGGVFCQWLQLYGMQTSDLKALARTFASVFPNVAVFNTIRDSDLLLIGSEKPLDFKLDDIADRMSDLDVAVDLGRVHVVNPYDLLTYFIMGTAELRAFAGDGPLNTDDNALIEFHAPRSLHAETRGPNLLEIRKHVVDPLKYLQPRPSDPAKLADEYQKLSVAYYKRGMNHHALGALETALSLDKTDERVEMKQQLLDEIAEREKGDKS
ncbi:MAG TPA: fused MFS/spermidine synthase, partial [Candidatus Saccharimonadales bacterium]|nr:fused MFS/spermidine synthase [Candidatus Saccharimonadales bacterium]